MFCMKWKNGLVTESRYGLGMAISRGFGVAGVIAITNKNWMLKIYCFSKWYS